MKLTRNFVLLLAALFFGFLVIPRAAQAQVTNCPTEPKSDVPIADGETFVGTNCVLNSVGDVDSFVFNANAGDTYQIALGFNGPVNAQICVTLYDPNSTKIFPNTSNPNNCTTWNGNFGALAVVDNQTLALTGTYTIDVTEATTAGESYALSLERLFPFPPNAVDITTLGSLVSADLAAPTQAGAFIFTGVTTGQFQVTAALTGPVTSNICLAVYSPTGTLVTPTSGTGTNPVCTTWNGNFGTLSVPVDFIPTVGGTYMAFVQAVDNDATQTYSMEVSCLSGNCGNTKTPPCTLKDSLSYNASTGTLTMNFTEGNTAVDTWNSWLTDQNTVTQLFSASQPITNPPVPITKTRTLSPEGTVGVLSTLTTAKKGIICSVYTQVNTGTPLSK
jgi:hypothetical protein